MIMRILALWLAVGLLAIFGAVTARATVVSGPISNGSSSYYLLSKQSWTAAETEAIGLGGHLVTVNDATENTFLVNSFVLGGHSGDPLWIGLNDATTEGTFVWSSGQPVTFTDWQPGEPNNSGGNEDYATINWHFANGATTDHATWNDAPLNGTVGYAGTTNGPYFGIVEVPHTSADYNHNGIVDAADYVLWRKDPPTYNGDPDGYIIWRQNFGSIASGSGISSTAAIPEPKILPLLSIPVFFLMIVNKRDAPAGIRKLQQAPAGVRSRMIEPPAVGTGGCGG
jgi:hypothetical protein